MTTLTAWADCLTDVADELERANRGSLLLPGYHKERLAFRFLEGTTHFRDALLMERLARERRYRPEQSAARKHFYRAWQGCSASEIQDAAARGW